MYVQCRFGIHIFLRMQCERLENRKWEMVFACKCGDGKMQKQKQGRRTGKYARRDSQTQNDQEKNNNTEFSVQWKWEN